MSATLRVVSYNVRHLRDDSSALVRVVRSLEPDVLCLQETPRHPLWRSRLAGLARDTGLLYAAGGRGSGNCAVLAHLRVDVKGSHEVRFSKRPRLHRRGMVVVDLAVGGLPVSVASTHLGLDAAERVIHVGEALRFLDAMGAWPAVLAGDLNEKPGGPTWQALGARFRDSWVLAPRDGEATFPAVSPRKRIDAVLVDPGVAVDGCGVPAGLVAPEAATDHLPVVADLRLG
jgi:endonuclease/exonuclease/phosphatase family metal-dependent hydrolase